MGYTRKSQIAEGKKIPALNEDERIVKTLAAGSGGGGGGGGGVSLGFEIFLSKWTQNPDYEEVYDIAIYAYGGDEINEIATCSASREVDQETFDVRIVVGEVLFTDNDYEAFAPLICVALNTIGEVHNAFFAELTAGAFPEFGLALV